MFCAWVKKCTVVFHHAGCRKLFLVPFCISTVVLLWSTFKFTYSLLSSGFLWFLSSYVLPRSLSIFILLRTEFRRSLILFHSCVLELHFYLVSFISHSFFIQSCLFFCHRELPRNLHVLTFCSANFYSQFHHFVISTSWQHCYLLIPYDCQLHSLTLLFYLPAIVLYLQLAHLVFKHCTLYRNSSLKLT